MGGHEGNQEKSIIEGIEKGPERGPKGEQLQLLDWQTPGPEDHDACEMRLWQMKAVAKGDWTMFPVRLVASADRPGDTRLHMVAVETGRDLRLLQRLAAEAGISDLALTAA